ncbi:MAG: Gfo/Idh/MocA family oxidoreductase [Thermoproteota archaeon]
MSKTRFAVLSFAHIHAWSYARVLKELPETELVAIYDDSPERLRRAGETYGVKKLYDDVDKLLQAEEIDALVITSENSKHRALAIAAAEAGKHMIVEKPIATTLRDADEIVSKAERNSVKLQIAFVMRFHDSAVKAGETILSGALGRVIAITATNHGKYPDLWFADPELAGGGAIMDHTVHVADLTRWYTGDEFSRVFCRIGRNIRRELKVEDNALLICETRKGVKVSIDCSWSRPDTYPVWGDVYMGVFGEKGYLVLDAFRSNVSLVQSSCPLTYHYHGPDADRNMILDFINVIRTDGKPRASGHDGRQALEVALAAYESSKQGKAVSLPVNR